MRERLNRFFPTILSRKHSLSAIWRHSLSLLIIFFLALVLVFLLLYNNVASLNASAVRLADQNLETFSNSIGTIYTNYNRLLAILSTNANLAKYAGHTDATSIDVLAYDGYDLQKDMLSLMSLYGDYVNTIAIYFPASRSVVTMARQLPSDSTHLFFLDYPEIHPSKLDTLSFDGYNNTQFITYGAHNWIIRKTSAQNVNPAYILIKCTPIQNITVILNNSDDYVVFVGDMNTCFFTNTGQIDDSTYQDIVHSMESGDSFLFGREYRALSYPSSFPNINITVGFPSSNITQIQRPLIAVFLVVSFISILAFGAIFSSLKSKVLAPLDKLAGEREYNKSNYANIVSEISNYFSEMESDRNRLLQQRDYLTPLALGKAVNRLNDANSNSEALSFAQSCLLLANVPHGSMYAVFAITLIEDSEEYFTGLITNGYGQTSSLLFFLDNVLNDLLFCSYPGLIVPLKANSFIVTVSCADEDPKGISEACNRLISFYEENFSVLLAVSEIHFGTSNGAFADAIKSLNLEVDYLSFWGSRDGTTTSSTETVSFNSCCNDIRKLISNLNNMNFDGIWASFDQVLKQAIPTGEEDIDLAKYRIYAMTSFIIAAVEEKLEDRLSFSTLRSMVSRLYEVDNISDYRDEIKKLLLDVVQVHETINKTRFISGRMEDIRKYILSHYTENTLNVASIAERFGISVSYLSRSFKAAYNTNLLEYIQRLRVDAAKPLLLINPVQSVAQSVGFWDSQGLIRAFKKYEGINPSDYKRLSEIEREWK